MKSICFFNSNKVWGGGEKWHHEMACYFHEHGWRVVVITNTQSALYQRLASTGVPVRQIGVSNLSFLNIPKLIALSRLLKKDAIETIVLNLPSDLKLGGIAAKIAGVRNIIYRRGLARPVRNTWLNRALFQRVLTGVIANSEEMVRTILQQNPALISPERIHIIYNGINLREYDREEVVPLYTKKQDEIVLGNAGRLVEQKAQRYLIDLAAILKSRKIPFTLLIAGTGKLEAELKQYARTRDVEQEVRFVGFVEHIKAFMQSIDIFLLSSLYEGFGFVLAEAMAAGKPVIAFDVSSNPELVVHGQTGFLAELGNMAEVAQYVEELRQDQAKRRAFGLKARQRIEEKFAFHTLAQQVMTLIEQESSRQ